MPFMDPIAPETWECGFDYKSYRAQIETNGEKFDAAYGNPGYSGADVELLRALPSLKVLALGEDWCPDVYHTLPTWARLVEELPGWSLKIFPRDSHPDLVESFLWNGRAQRIPVYAFYDRRGYLQAWWSGRCRAAQEALDAFRGGRNFSDLNPEEKAEGRRVLDEGYEREFRRGNLQEILTILRAFFHR